MATATPNRPLLTGIKREPRRFRFSLRTLFVVVVVVGMVLGWFAMQWERERRRREAAAPFRELGGRVTFCEAGDAARIETIDLSCLPLTDADLEPVKRLTHLRGLYLYNTQVTNEGIKDLQQTLPNCTTRRSNRLNPAGY